MCKVCVVWARALMLVGILSLQSTQQTSEKKASWPKSFSKEGERSVASSRRCQDTGWETQLHMLTDFANPESDVMYDMDQQTDKE